MNCFSTITRKWNHLVPESLFREESHKVYLDLLNGDLQQGVVISEKILGWNHFNVFRMPQGILDLLQSRFPGMIIRHFYSLWMECLKKQMLISLEYIAVIFYPNRILVSVIKNHQLQLIQEFPYQVAEDVSYHLLNICELMELSPATVPLRVSGMLEESSAMFSEIQKYFGKAQLDPAPYLGPSSEWNDYPTHFFSPLLKLSVCV
jgi:hypothetical protein